MNVQSLLEKVESSSVFTAWRNDHSSPYLAHVFIMYDNDTVMDQQVGYFDPDKDKMNSFTITGNDITLIPEADVFKKPNAGEVKPLDTASISVSFDEVKEQCEKLLKEKYHTTASKKIFILQHLPEGQVWNCTFLTSGFATMNVRVDASSGEVLKDEHVNLIDMQNSK
jgi:hypothetical protein